MIPISHPAETIGAMPLTHENQNLQFIRELLRQRTGILLREDQDYVTEARLTSYLRESSLSSVDELVRGVRANPAGSLQVQMIESLINHETSFFRDVHQFETLKNQILPEVIQHRKSARTLRIWSAACSAGQEPYSLAMLIRDHFEPQLTGWNRQILATDLSDRILRTARAGRYTQLEIGRGLPARLLVRHFDKLEDEWEVQQPVRDLVEFRRLNLIESFRHLPSMDIVLLRNALIYFDNESKGQVLRQVYDVLSDGGYLLLGVGESPREWVPEFESISGNSTVIFRKPLTGGAI